MGLVLVCVVGPMSCAFPVPFMRAALRLTEKLEKHYSALQTVCDCYFKNRGKWRKFSVILFVAWNTSAV